LALALARGARRGTPRTATAGSASAVGGGPLIPQRPEPARLREAWNTAGRLLFSTVCFAGCRPPLRLLVGAAVLLRFSAVPIPWVECAAKEAKHAASMV